VKYEEVTAILGNAVQSSGLVMNVYYYVPRSVVPPSAIIKPQAHRTIDYMQTQGECGLAKWYFLVMLVIGQVDEQAAQEEAGVLVSPRSSLIRALTGIKFPTSGYVQVTEGAVSEMMFADGLYTYAQLSVTVCA
jgi:hypothetical protein